MRIPRTIAVYRLHLEARYMLSLCPTPYPATIWSITHNQQCLQVLTQSGQRLTHIRRPGKREGFRAIAGPDVDTRQQGTHQRRVRRLDQRARVEYHHDLSRQRQQPVKQRLRLTFKQQAVATDVHIIIDTRDDLSQVVGAQLTLGAEMGDEGAFGARFSQRHAQPGIFASAGRQGHFNTFGLHRGTRQLAKAPLAMAAQINHRQPIAPCRSHYVETATDLETGGVGQHVTAACRQGVEAHDQVDNDLAGVQQSSHWRSLLNPDDGQRPRPRLHIFRQPPRRSRSSPARCGPARSRTAARQTRCFRRWCRWW